MTHSTIAPLGYVDNIAAPTEGASASYLDSIIGQST